MAARAAIMIQLNKKQLMRIADYEELINIGLLH